MKIEKIKPIPKYMIELIRKEDIKCYPSQDGNTRYYAYLTKNDGELVKVTVAVKSHYKKWYCKQVIVHGVHSDICFLKDIAFYYIGGYVTSWYAEGLHRYRKYYECGEWGWQWDKFEPFAPVINKEYALKFPEYKYSQIQNYHGVKVLQYLRLYEQYPLMELFMKFGLERLVMNKTILRKAVKNKPFAKWLARNNKELNDNIYYTNAILRAYKYNTPILQEHIKEEILRKDKKGKYDEIKKIYGNEWSVLCEYVIKQMANMQSYIDYYNACIYLHIDMSLPKNRYPHNFKRWHDIRTDEYATAKAKADAEKLKELTAKFAKVADKYLPLQMENAGVYIAIIPHSPKDLTHEGNILNHCVGRMNYDQKFIREETLIFFIRLKDKPDIPLVTVEYSPSRKTVLQCYGKDDKRPSAEILEFVNSKWLPYANRTIRKIAA